MKGLIENVTFINNLQYKFYISLLMTFPLPNRHFCFKMSQNADFEYKHYLAVISHQVLRMQNSLERLMLVF